MTPPPADDDASPSQNRVVIAAEPARGAAIDVSALVAGWRNAPPVLSDVSLTLQPGATTIVHGGAGAGKSTLLHVLRAAMAPRAGRVLLLGSDVVSLPVHVRRALKQRIGYIAQAPLLSVDDTAFAAVAAPLTFAAPALQARAGADVTDILGYLGLAEWSGERVGALSHAQRRLVCIARAFVAQPDIVLADEPLAGLSGDAMSRVLRLLSEIARQRAAVVIATQTPEVFAALPATKMRLERGRTTGAAT